MQHKDFTPFFDRLSKKYLAGFVGKLAISIFFGLFVLGLHYIAIQEQVFHNFGWILSLIIFVASLSLFYASHCFRQLISKLNCQLSSSHKIIFSSNINKYLNDKRFIVVATLFAFLNCCLGLLFKIPSIYESLIDQVIILFSYFTAGFICGLALAGILGVVKTISNLYNIKEYCFDYTSDDKCGGTQFIGWSLIIFSTVTLFVGILITLYISKTQWNNEEPNLFINILYFSWVALPYIASIVVLIVPAIAINKQLIDYKLHNDRKLSNIISNIFKELESNNISCDRKAELYADFEFQKSMRKTLYEMRTWPFNLGANATYFLSLCVSLTGTIASIHSWADKNIT